MTIQMKFTQTLTKYNCATLECFQSRCFPEMFTHVLVRLFLVPHFPRSLPTPVDTIEFSIMMVNNVPVVCDSVNSSSLFSSLTPASAGNGIDCGLSLSAFHHPTLTLQHTRGAIGYLHRYLHGHPCWRSPTRVARPHKISTKMEEYYLPRSQLGFNYWNSRHCSPGQAGLLWLPLRVTEIDTVFGSGGETWLR